MAKVFRSRVKRAERDLSEKSRVTHSRSYRDATILGRGAHGIVLDVAGTKREPRRALKIVDVFAPEKLDRAVREMALYDCLAEDGIAPRMYDAYIVYTFGDSSVRVRMRDGVGVQLVAPHPVFPDAEQRSMVMTLEGLAPCEEVPAKRFVDSLVTPSPIVCTRTSNGLLVINTVVASTTENEVRLGSRERSSAKRATRTSDKMRLRSEMSSSGAVPSDAVVYRTLLCMERYDSTLSSIIDDTARVERIVPRIVELIEALIERGVVCFDINASNVVVSADDVRLIDFGVWCDDEDTSGGDFWRGIMLSTLVASESRLYSHFKTDIEGFRRRYKTRIKRFMRDDERAFALKWWLSVDE